jgi:hypothetical protein
MKMEITTFEITYHQISRSQRLSNNNNNNNTLDLYSALYCKQPQGAVQEHIKAHIKSTH